MKCVTFTYNQLKHVSLQKNKLTGRELSKNNPNKLSCQTHKYIKDYNCHNPK